LGGRSVQKGARKVARVQMSGPTHEQAAGDGTTRHVIDVIVRARPPTRKV
jgi:hypothetical protein